MAHCGSVVRLSKATKVEPGSEADLEIKKFMSASHGSPLGYGGSVKFLENREFRLRDVTIAANRSKVSPGIRDDNMICTSRAVVDYCRGLTDRIQVYAVVDDNVSDEWKTIVSTMSLEVEPEDLFTATDLRKVVEMCPDRLASDSADEVTGDSMAIRRPVIVTAPGDDLKVLESLDDDYNVLVFVDALSPSNVRGMLITDGIMCFCCGEAQQVMIFTTVGEMREHDFEFDCTTCSSQAVYFRDSVRSARIVGHSSTDESIITNSLYILRSSDARV